METTERTFTGRFIDGECVPVEIPTRLPVEEWTPDNDNQPVPFRRTTGTFATPYQEYAAEQSAKYTRDRIYQNNAAQWLRETVEALADQADFTPSAVLADLCETYDRKARGCR